MAYNNLSGTVILPELLTTQLDLSPGSMVSGNLSTSDGADIVNVPRLNNAVAGAIVTNVGGDFNTLTTNGNLIFDGTTLTILGNLTASINISASAFYGDGSNLTGISAGGGGTGGGIFTELTVDKAFTTSSVQIGSNATPNNQLSVAGSSFLSGAVVHKRVTTTSNYTISATDYYICADTTGGELKLTLPQASTITSGQTFIIKDEGGASESNPITVSGSAADQIDGQNMIILESPYAAISIYCNGINKYFIY